MKTGLILVDIQNDYFSGGKVPLEGIDEAAQNAKELLAFFRNKKLSTYHIQHLSLSKEVPFFVPDTTGVDIHESIKPAPEDKIIQKHFPNSFRETELLEALRADGIEEVVICGAMSHMCIDATTRAAADLGFKCQVIHDACATRDLVFGDTTVPASQVHASFMAALGSAYAKVSPLKKFLAKFDQDND